MILCRKNLLLKSRSIFLGYRAIYGRNTLALRNRWNIWPIRECSPLQKLAGLQGDLRISRIFLHVWKFLKRDTMQSASTTLRVSTGTKEQGEINLYDAAPACTPVLHILLIRICQLEHIFI